MPELPGWPSVAESLPAQAPVPVPLAAVAGAVHVPLGPVLCLPGPPVLQAAQDLPLSPALHLQLRLRSVPARALLLAPGVQLHPALLVAVLSVENAGELRVALQLSEDVARQPPQALPLQLTLAVAPAVHLHLRLHLPAALPASLHPSQHLSAALLLHRTLSHRRGR